LEVSALDELEAFRGRVDAHWPAVDQYLDGLPGDLYRQGRLLRENLALRHSPTGDFHDILRGTRDHPLLHYHLWILDDLGISHDAQRRSIESDLFAAMVFALGVVTIQREVIAPDSFVDEQYIGLADSLSRRGARHFSAVVEAGSPFWETHQRLWDAAAAVDVDGEDQAPTETRLGPFMLSGLAGLEATNRADLSGGLIEMLEHINSVFAIRHDLLGIRRDLARGRLTGPVRAMITGAGLAEDETADPDGLLGTLLLTGAVDAVEPSWRRQVDAVANSASDLGLPTFGRYATLLATGMEAIQAVLRVPGGPNPAGGPPPRFEAATTPLPDAIAMAEGYLAADPTFRDAWEVHRWGMAGAAEVTARFPAGLVIEALGNHGHDVADLADEFYQSAGEQGFAYYDHPAIAARRASLDRASRFLAGTWPRES